MKTPTTKQTENFLKMNSEMWEARAEMKRNPAAAPTAKKLEKKVRAWRRKHEAGFEG